MINRMTVAINTTFSCSGTPIGVCPITDINYYSAYSLGHSNGGYIVRMIMQYSNVEFMNGTTYQVYVFYI